ncbi:hypothetical protein B0186_04465 [Canicola haemoglobinophilus]|uniref:Uncharacterized protein n=1 Tax=Canicola haemoglobinophilus TaxID=733 RepID=A0A1V4B1V1_9PAST|nr:hypothetical protein [Canicola haemoglobinophilus]OOS01185.1 hypothetical protein B0186_04465 [Canicola haemoglobinophilus]STO61036.1 Uncharacterised protein [Canicola haemoglobinophilus]
MTEKQTIEQLNADFQKEKTVYLQEVKKLEDLKAQKKKAENIVLALKTELEKAKEQPQKILSSGKKLQLEDYKKARLSSSETIAEIEYYQAFIEDIADIIYTQKETVFYSAQKLRNIKGGIFNLKAKELIVEFTKENKNKLSEIASLIYFSNLNLNEKKLWNGVSDNEDRKEKTLSYLLYEIKKVIIISQLSDNEFNIHKVVNSDEVKSIMTKHRESIEQAHSGELKGFNKLIKNLNQG